MFKYELMPYQVAEEQKYTEVSEVLRKHALQEKFRKKARICVVS